MPAGKPDTRVAVIYYSATGNVHGLARAVGEGAEQAGAQVRLRHVEELASELQISQSQYWGRHRSQVAEAPVATLDDLDWADAVAFGTPTRFGNVAAQRALRSGGADRETRQTRRKLRHPSQVAVNRPSGSIMATYPAARTAAQR